MERYTIEVTGSPSISGHLDEVTLCDLCQALSRKDGLLKVSSAHLKGHIFFGNGQIIHAEIGDLTGRSAVVELVAIAEGDFSYFNDIAPPIQTVRDSMDSILMEAALYTDYVNELAKHNIHVETKLKLNWQADPPALPDDAPGARVIGALRKEPQPLWEVLNFLDSHGIDRADGAKLILEFVIEQILISTGEIEYVPDGEPEPDPVPAAAPAAVPVAAAPAATPHVTAAPSPEHDRPHVHDRPHDHDHDHGHEHSSAQHSPPGEIPRYWPDGTRQEAAPRSSSHSGTSIALLIAALIVLASIGAWQFSAPAREFFERLKSEIKELDPRQDSATNEWTAEVKAAIDAAPTFIYGTVNAANQDPLTPADIARLNKAGFDSDSLMREVKRRGFTGFPDPIEEQRARSAWGDQAIININLPAQRLSQGSLKEFVSRHPFTRAKSGLGATDTVLGKNAATARAMEPAILLLEKTIQGLQAKPEQATILSLKLILLRQRILELNENPATP